MISNYKKMKKIYHISIALAVVLLPLSVVADSLWEAPTQPPPGGNRDRPIHVGTESQQKSGPLTINNNFSVAGNGLVFGNLGIGMASLNGRLTVSNSQPDGGQTVANSGIAFNQTGGWSQAAIYPVGSTGFNGHLVFATDGDGVNNNNPSEKMRILSNGNTGIGVTTPNERLQVAGNVRATGFCLGSGACITAWPTGGGGGAGTVTSITAGTGLNGGTITNSGTISANTGYLQRRVSGSCPSGQSIRVINEDGTVACQVDNTGSGGIGAESDTLATVVSRGNSTGSAISVGGMTSSGSVTASSLNSNGDITIGGGSTIRNQGGRLHVFPGTDIYLLRDVVASRAWGGSGNITAEGSFFYSSDRSLKDEIKPVVNALDKTMNLSGVSFNWKHNGKSSIGFVAQDVEKVLPEIVATDKETGLKSVEYGNITALLVEAIKEQQKQIDSLKAEIESLKR